MKAFISTVFIAAVSFGASAELIQLEDKSLESVSAQSNGLTIDIDLTGLAFTYSYQNDQNGGEDYWVMGSNTGSGGAAVEGVGAGAGLVRFEGITIDVVSDLPGLGTTPAIAIGLPETVRLNRVNTGDYYIAHANPSDADAPPIAVDPDSDRKLIGLKWNTPPPLDFAAGGQTDALSASGTGVSDVILNNFTTNTLQMEGQIYIFAN